MFLQNHLLRLKYPRIGVLYSDQVAKGKLRQKHETRFLDRNDLVPFPGQHLHSIVRHTNPKPCFLTRIGRD